MPHSVQLVSNRRPAGSCSNGRLLNVASGSVQQAHDGEGGGGGGDYNVCACVCVL